MSFFTFCRDKLMVSLIYTAVLTISFSMLYLLGISAALLLFLTITWVLAGIAMLLYEFFRRRKFYQELFDELDALDQKYYLSEMVAPAGFAESEMICDILEQTNRSMREQVNYYRRLSEEYREYIEMWIHEVKTPIASSRLIIQNHQDEATASIAEELDKVEEYVEQVLYYSRSSNVEKDYIIRKFPLKDAVFPVVKKHYRDFTGHKIVLSVDNLEFEVFSDTKWLEFILNQIVTNSIKYAREERAFIKIEAFEQKENIVLTIKDNGIGITKRDLGRVFEKGFTGENGRKYAKSTGMGLYICKKLCDKMGLAMKLYSEEGKGTEVLISFPRSRMVRFES